MKLLERIKARPLDPFKKPEKIFEENDLPSTLSRYNSRDKFCHTPTEKLMYAFSDAMLIGKPI